MTACSRSRTTFGPEEAYAYLEPFFRAARDVFVERGLTRCESVRLIIDPEAHDTDRHYAGCSEDGVEIVAAPEMPGLETDHVIAIFAHEFGHASDFLYPARFFVADGELVSAFEGERRRALEDLDQRSEYNRRRLWEERQAHDVEVTADLIATHITRREIRYAGPCMLQTFGPGKRRPRNLR